MSTDDLLAAYQIHGDKIVGCWHTHVEDKYPSELDKQYAPPEMRYWIATPDSVLEFDMQQPVLTIVSSWHANG
jgi:proteasome lid subunit RPN8/RPN11